jgi:hypothetical protein
MYNHNESHTVFAETINYSISGIDYDIEFGVYVDLESEDFKFAIIEEAYNKDELIRKEVTLTKTKELIMNVLEERKTTLKLRSDK